jgi:hypothetical protein
MAFSTSSSNFDTWFEGDWKVVLENQLCMAGKSY